MNFTVLAITHTIPK